MRRMERLPTPQGISPGATATLNIPLGPTYNILEIRCNAQIGGSPTNLAPADWGTVFDDIRLLVDGDVKIEAKASELVKMFQFYGYTLRAGVLPIFLALPWARTVLGEELTAYGTAGGLQSFTLEMDVKDGQTVNSLKVYADISEPKPFGKHLVIRRFAKAFGSVGIDEVADLPRRAYNMIALHIGSTSIGEIEIFASGSDGQSSRVHVSDKEIREQDYYISKREKQAATTHIDFCPKDRIVTLRQNANGVTVPDAEAFPMLLTDFRMKLDFTSSPGSYDIMQVAIEG